MTYKAEMKRRVKKQSLYDVLIVKAKNIQSAERKILTKYKHVESLQLSREA
jgi:hypothetical protein